MIHAAGVRVCAIALVTILAVLTAIACDQTAPPSGDLGQGWKKADREWWYRVSQGSRLLPYKWAQALKADKTGGGEVEVFGDANVSAFGYLTEAALGNYNKEGLPIGFALDPGDAHQERGGCRQFPKMCKGGVLRQTWLGLNCSACHTNDIIHDGKRLRIDGAATLADFTGFFDQVLNALITTHDRPAKFTAFAAAVLGSGATDAAKLRLKEQLAELIAWESALRKQNGGTIEHAGRGRLDAQGHILAKVATIVVGGGEQLRDFASDAPASYPFIWNAPQHDTVQWNGIAPNKIEYELGPQRQETNIGALARNVGEVVGVFAHVDAAPEAIEPILGGIPSSAQTINIIDIERRLMKLRSPVWPGSINKDLLPRGKELYDANCLSCHAILKPDELTKPIEAKMQSLKSADTDIWLACNTYLSKVKAGSFSGLRSLIVPLIGETIQPVDRTALLLNRTVASVIVGDRGALLESALRDVFARERTPKFLVIAAVVGETEYLPGVDDPIKKERAKKCLKDSGAANFKALGLAYKARPLNGVWATAPYLHNGSVPSLYDLLLPGAVQNTIVRKADGTIISAPLPVGPTRPIAFWVGNRTLDTKKVGFVYDQKAGFEFRVLTPEGKPILGNYNSGHNYGTRFSEEDRWALVEYLKGL
jgi:hypothetical protein